jgi:hypothetical protein
LRKAVDAMMSLHEFARPCGAWRCAFLGAATLLAACAAAPPAPPPQDVTQADIARYRFGMYRDCVESGAQNGTPPDIATGFCDCADETLGRQVPEADWRLAVRAFLQQRPEEEHRVLAPYMAQTAACHAQAPGAGRNPAQAAAYLGYWSAADTQADCRESFDFGSDGTLRIESGDERTVNSYTLGKALNPAGRLEVRTTVLKTVVGRNCAGHFADLTGQSRSLFIEPGPLGASIAVCESAAGVDCTGPLRKEAPGGAAPR